MPHISVAELVARQFAPGGYGRLDLAVMYAAIAGSANGDDSALELFEKLLRSDTTRRDADVALLALLRRGRFHDSVHVAARPAIDPDLHLIANVAGLAAAIHTDQARVPVKIWKSQGTTVYDAAWFASHGFTSVELDRIEAARAAVYRRLGLADLPWRAIAAAQADLGQHLDPSDRMHGLGRFYQSCEDLLINGQRPTSLRFSAYGLGTLLDRNQRLLDIGCNCGFLALHCAPHVRQVDGFDINPRFTAIGNAAARVLGRSNCSFATSSFADFTGTGPYDVIFSFAVHHWIGEPMPAYAQRLRQLLKPGGKVLLESQDVSTHDADWDARLAAFCSAGYEPLTAGTLCDDGVRTRRHVLLRDTRG